MRNRSLTFRVTAAVVALVATVCVLLTLLTASALARFLDDRLAEDLAASHGRAARAHERGRLPAPPPGGPRRPPTTWSGSARLSR